MVGEKTAMFSESVIREMTRKAIAHNAVNLSQGLPDIPTPTRVVDAGVRALQAGKNQYSFTWGAPELRRSLAGDLRRRKGLAIDPETDLVITCGDAEAVMVSILALTNPGDRVAIVEPYYENYLPGCVLGGARPVFARLADDLTLDENSFKDAFAQNPSLLLLNTPNNPTGKVFSREELLWIGSLCQKYGTVAITDETYEHIIYNGKSHIALGSLSGMEDRTVTTSSFGKSFCVTGWRVGYAAACERLMAPIRKVHDFTTICAPTPFQHALAEVLDDPGDLYDTLLAEYDRLRNWFVPKLEQLGFEVAMPDGAYYVPAGFSAFGYADDFEFADYLVEKIGVATVPGSSFFHSRKWPRVRFTFSRKEKTLREALERLEALKR